MARTDVGSAIAHFATLIGLYKNYSDQDMAAFIKRCQQENIFLSYNGSITKLVSKYVVEPVIICTDKLKTHELTDKINKLNTDIFASFYSQAFQILTSGHNLQGNTAIELLSTDTGGFISATTDRLLNVLSQEGHVGGFHANLVSDGKYLNISFGLEDDFDDIKGAVLTNAKNGTVAKSIKDNFAAANSGKKSGKKNNPNNGNKTSTDDDANNSSNGKNDKNGNANNKIKVIRETTIKSVDDDNNLAMSTIFKTFNVTISNLSVDGNKVLSTLVIPITIKTYVLYTKVEQIVNMIEPKDMKKSFLYRLDEYKSGAIKFRDLIFAGDLIKSYKKNKLKDKDNLLQLINNREQTSASKSIKYGKEGFEKFYNMIVLTSDELVLFKRSVGGDIDKPNYKDKFLNMVRGLSFTVVDLDYERVTIYIKDLTGKSDISFNGLKRKKDGDFQITDFLKTMMNNNHPVF